MPSIINIVLFGFSAAAILLMLLWVRDLIFYWKNNWDFSLSHGSDFFVGVEGDMRQPVSNRTRVTFAYPISIALILVGILITSTT